MSHTTASKKQLTARVRRIIGQLEGIERALEDEADCEKVLHLVSGPVAQSPVSPKKSSPISFANTSPPRGSAMTPGYQPPTS